ncbi:Cytochrome b561 and DOMON domain-containing protein [Heracleum sosnowskyi]|uniref:Cytochrome b561 and DOMON domain-containing protein n=1 Tax=Heracleum sosnowskyi TaxID=360622 RepID=A0AAD8N4Z6_9APIA|nr:Cytochrome b561 and DOMON domain-containing protein [Heracleum sosnowskyi]
MDRLQKTLLLSCVLFYVFASTSAQDCNNYAFRSNNKFSTCSSLPEQNAFLHWTYNSTDHTADIAFRHGSVSTSRWVAWALNINKTGMAGAQSLVAFQNSSGAMRFYTSPVASTAISGLTQGPLSFDVPKMSAEFVSSSSEIIIYATLNLPKGRTSFSQVWQEGPVSSDNPSAHALGSANTKSVGTVDFSSGQTTAGGGVGNSKRRRRNVHGVLNTVAWGILLPLGALTARYLKVFKSADPAWFYLHAFCQSSAYIVGVAGWGTGLKLGSDSPGITYDKHRNIGITLFCLGTLQVFALLLRPKKDHKYRLYWNIYHHAIGYTVIALSIANIFEGFDILDPAKKWKRAYIGVIIFLAVVAAILEALTWFIVLKRKDDESDKYPQGVNGNGNGVNGYGNGGYRSQQAA